MLRSSGFAARELGELVDQGNPKWTHLPALRKSGWRNASDQRLGSGDRAGSPSSGPVISPEVRDQILPFSAFPARLAQRQHRTRRLRRPDVSTSSTDLVDITPEVNGPFFSSAPFCAAGETPAPTTRGPFGPSSSSELRARTRSELKPPEEM